MRSDILTIAKRPYNLIGENTIDEIDYSKWVDFINSNSEYFIWYENTDAGKEALKTIDKVPDWAKERVSYSLNKKRAYSTNKLMKKPTELVVTYSESDSRVGISLEINLDKEVAMILISMAKHLDALLLKNGSEIINEDVLEELK